MMSIYKLNNFVEQECIIADIPAVCPREYKGGFFHIENTNKMDMCVYFC